MTSCSDVAGGLSPRRVVVTGLGLATSLGFEVEEVWQALIDGRSGIGFLEQFDSRGFPVRAGGEIKSLPPDSEASSQPNRTLRFAVWAARRAFQDAGLDTAPFDLWDRRRAGVVLGAGLFPVMEDRLGETAAEMFDGDGLSTANHLEACRKDPALLTQQSLGSVSGTLSSLLGLGGPSLTVQSACTSATQAIGEAWERIRRGRADVIVTGGADSMMSMFCVAGFAQLGALSRNPDPRAASRPFDGRRDGFVLGEGAGILV
jgi:3-oxoacyl-[acyl-carrier-protein] synthase II